MRRITKAALGGLAGCALVIAGTQAAVGELTGDPTYVFEGPLRDLDLANPGPFDSAKAVAKIWETSDGRTEYSVQIRGIDQSLVPPVNPLFDPSGDVTYLSHLHIGKCQKDEPAQTDRHWVIPDGTLNNEADEVWFRFTPKQDGTASATASTTVVPSDFYGDQWMSIVVHNYLPTTPDVSGPRVACLPLDFSKV